MAADLTALAKLLCALDRDPAEHITICTTPPGGVFTPTITTVGQVQVPDTGDVWYLVGVLHPGVATGKGRAQDIVGVRELYADLDVKPGGLPDYDAARHVIGDLSGMLGTAPVAIVATGGGLQPHWMIERDEGTDWPGHTDPRWLAAKALLRRFGRLVAGVAERRGGRVDSVFNLDRVLRAPGTANCKYGTPRQVTAEYPGGGAVSLQRLAETLDEYGVPERPEDREDMGEVRAAPEGWRYGTATCRYVAAMINGWATDRAPGGRHQWLVGQAHRLAAAHRLGCLTAADHQRGAATLGGRFAERVRTTSPVREVSHGEVPGALSYGVARVATFSDVKTRAELDDHQHAAEALASWTPDVYYDRGADRRGGDPHRGWPEQEAATPRRAAAPARARRGGLSGAPTGARRCANLRTT